MNKISRINNGEPTVKPNKFALFYLARHVFGVLERTNCVVHSSYKEEETFYPRGRLQRFILVMCGPGLSGLGPDKIAGQAKVVGLGLARAWSGLSQGFKGIWETIRFKGERATNWFR
jgi:hypothetical protein